MSYFICVTCLALLMFLRTCYISCEFFTLTLGGCGPQLAVVFFKSIIQVLFCARPGRRKEVSFCTEEWSILENGRFYPAPAVYGHFFLPPQSKYNSLFFCLYSCWKCECSSPSRQDIQFYSEGTVKLGTGISWLKFRKSKYSGCRKCKSACRPS